MIKNIFIYLAVWMLSFSLYAQNKYTISGKVIDEELKGLSDATIILRNQKDSTLIAGIITDKKGVYSLKKIAKGNYLMVVSFIGYKTVYKKVKILDNDLNVNDISLEVNSTMLESVVVRSKKPLIIRKPDKTVVTIKNSIYETGENGFDLLNILPEVRTDGLGNIDFRGEQGVIVYLDDKRIRLTSQQLRGYLKGIPSETIDSFEIKSVPGVEYDAEGTAAIINIVTKKEYKYGLSGTLTSHYEQHRYSGMGVGSILRYNTGKFNFSTNYNFTVFNFFNDTDRTRKYKQENSFFQFDQEETYREKYDDHAFDVGVDYNISDGQKAGIQYQLKYTDWQMRLSSQGNMLHQPSQIDSIFTTVTREDEFLNNQSINAFYEIQIDTLNSKFQFDYDYVTYRNPSNAFYRSNFLDVNKQPLREKDSSYIDNPISVKIHTVKSDLIKNVSQDQVVKFGAKLSFINTDNENTFYTGERPNIDVDLKRSNKFNYDERIYALYTSYGKEWEKWSLNLGVRVEKTTYRGNSITSNTSFERDRTDIFPSLFIKKAFNDNHILNLSYGRRILRPSYEWLNPFEDYGDPYSITTGNQNLTPAFSNALELSYLLQSKYYFTLGIKRTDNIIGQIFLQDENLRLISTYQNLSDEHRYFISGSVPFDVTSWWEVNSFINLYYKKIGINSGDNKGIYDQISYLLWFSNSFSLPQDYMLEVSAYYQSKTLMNIYDLKPQGSIDIAFKKSFLKDKLSLSFTVNDVFATQRSRVYANVQNVTQYSNSFFTSRTINIGASYNFSSGKKEAKSYDREGGNANEKNRIE